MISRVQEILAAASSPPSTEPCDRWIEKAIILGGDSDMQGRVSFELIPMARFFLRACQNARVRIVAAMISVQSAKTKTMEFFLMWKIKNQPAPVGWYMDVEASAKLFSQTRITQDFESTEAIRDLMPQSRDKKKWSLIQFAGMDFYIMGANNKRNRERISLETVICDERRNFPKGAMQSIKGRYKTFRSYKEISISTAGDEFDDMHQAFLQGTQHFFHWSCLQCGHRQTFRFGREATTLYPKARTKGGIVWDDNEATHPTEHVWNIAEMRKTVRYECEGCGHRYQNHQKPLLLATMNEENNWGAVQMNPMASPENISLHWNEMYMPWDECSWEKTAEKFLKAQMALTQNHDIEPLKVFVQESLGEPWRVFSEKPEPDEILKLKGDYKCGDVFDKEQIPNAVLILSVDVQKDFLVYVLRQWELAGAGASRLIHAGTFAGFNELREFQINPAHPIKGKCIFIDCAYANRAREVYDFCLRYGGNPMIGSDRPDFVQSFELDEAGKQKAVRTFWKQETIDPEQGRSKQGRFSLLRFSWSGAHYKDLFCFYILKGKAGKWELPSDVPRDYLEQLPGHRRVTNTSPEGAIEYEWVDDKPNDFADCELMQLAAADICHITKSTREK